MTTYTSRQLADILGPESITLRSRQQNLLRADWLPPSVTPPHGSGSVVHYDDRDLFVARVVLAVVPWEMGNSTSQGWRRNFIANAARDAYDQPDKRWLLYVKDRSPVLTSDDALTAGVFTVKRWGHAITIVDLDAYR